jgi:hypothetical protein
VGRTVLAFNSLLFELIRTAGYLTAHNLHVTERHWAYYTWTAYRRTGFNPGRIHVISVVVIAALERVVLQVPTVSLLLTLPFLHLRLVRTPLGVLYLYIDWLQAGRQRSQSSSLGGVWSVCCVLYVETGSGVHTTSCIIGYGAVAPRIKRPERKANYSSTTSKEVKKIWSYTSTPPYVFMA